MLNVFLNLIQQVIQAACIKIFCNLLIPSLVAIFD